ncbi:hypothetical protein GGX14DRAFT_661755, partial [Mycena pura]
MEYPPVTSCTANFYLDCPSDTEDSLHQGNGKPCKSYNIGRCISGKDCRGQHAGDSKSIRDRLGRNVCLLYLIDRCRFPDTPGECWYAHSRAHLPATGWWNNPKYFAYYGGMYDALKASGSHDVLMDRVLGGNMNGTWLPFEYREQF